MAHLAKAITKEIYEKIKDEVNIVGWKTKTGSEKTISIIIYDILTNHKFSEHKTNELTKEIMDLAKRNL